VTKELAFALRQCTISRFLFQQGIFDQKQHDCCPPATLLSLFPRFKIKLKDRHFYPIEVNKAESQAVLNTPTEHRLPGRI
jgi:predicted DNA-binding helix-hairpin-helix protein